MRNRKNFSRKTRGIMLILSAFVAVLILSACGSSNSSGSGGSSGGSSSSSSSYSSSSSSSSQSTLTYDSILAYINKHGYNNSNPGGDWENPSDGSLKAGDYESDKSNQDFTFSPDGKTVYVVSYYSSSWNLVYYPNGVGSNTGKVSKVLTDVNQITSASAQ